MAIDTTTSVDVQTLTPFKKFIMTIGAIPTSYLESMSYAELLMWFCNYLQNTVIPTVNNNGEAVEELQDLYEELRTYVNEYFENLDVQDEINNKLDAMAQDGSLYNIIKQYTDPIINDFENNIQSQINTQNANINALDTKINQVTSGSPLVASSTSGMTDTTRIYVNTTDGKWYYYDGDSWEIGGTYQSTGIDDNSIYPSQTVFYKDVQILPETDWVNGYVYNATNGNYMSFSTGSCCTKKIPCTPGEKIVFCDYTGFANIRVIFWNSSDEFLSTNMNVQTNQLSVITVPANASYFKYMYYTGNTSIKPLNANIYRFNDYFANTNNKKAILKNEYLNNIDTNDILITDKVKIIDKLFNIIANSSERNFNIYDNKINVTATLTSSDTTRYMGVGFRLKNVKVGDIIEFKSDLNKTATLYPWDITSVSPVTSSNFGAITLNGTAEYTVTQALVNYLNTSENNMICIGFGVLSTEEELNFYVEIKEKYGNTLYDFITKGISKETLNVIALGDSITALTGDRSWLSYFNQIQPINIIQNVAVNGAWLMDKEGTIYDGNPVFDGPDNNINNVLGNQVQKILNNNYSAPDIIMIAIGTNGGINCTEQEIYNSYYDASGNLIPLENVDRKTSAGAFRYCNTTLRTKYPNATIFWCSPIQGVNSIRNLNNIIAYGKNLKSLCKFASVQFIDTEDCGITGYTEINGSNGVYLADGLHPNSNGAKYMGYYNATKVKEYTESAKLL